MTARTEEYARLAAQGMTQAEIAAACNVSPCTVSLWAKRHDIALPDGRKSAANSDAQSVRAKRRFADPAFNPLAALTPAERAVYNVLKRKECTRDEALAAIGRADLIRDGNAVTPHSKRPGGHVPGSAPKGAGAAKEAPSTLMDARRAP